MIKKLVLIIIIGFTGLSLHSQSLKQRVADKLYNDLAYIQAVDMYKELAKKKSATEFVVRRAADCYRQLNDYQNSEKWYSKLSQMPGHTAEDLYYYAQMLKMNKKYEEANKTMAKLKEKSPNNSIAIAHELNSNYVSKIKSMPERFSLAVMKEKVNTSISDFGPTYYLKDGEINLVFASSRRNSSLVNKKFQWDGTNFLDVYESQLGGDGEPVEVKRFDRSVETKYHEGPVCFSNNGSKMYLTRSNYLAKKKGLDTARHNNLKLYLSEKDTISGEWGELKEFAYNNDNYSLGLATVTEDGKIMYFSSDMSGGKGNTDIWKSTFENGKWTKPINVESVNTEGREMFPYIGSSGILYISSDGFAGLGGLDLYRALPNGSNSFKKPMNMGYPLNSNLDDFSLIVNANEKQGYFASNRKGKEIYGSDDIYRVEILIPFLPQTYIAKGCAIDSESKKTLAGVDVKLINTTTNEIFTKITTSVNGCYEFTNIPEGKYRIEGLKNNFTTIYNHSFSTEDSKNGVIDSVNTILEKGKCSLLFLVLDQETGLPLEGAKIVLKDNVSGEENIYTTDSKGNVPYELKDYDCTSSEIDFSVSISKDKYLNKLFTYKNTLNSSGVIVIEKILPIFKEDILVNEFCEINQILYDFNKYNIREDAAIELDKLVKCMNDNPDMIIEIGAHTDCRGSRSYNRKLSDKRAKSASKYIVSKGISRRRISGKGYGEEQIKNGCECEGRKKSKCSDEEHQANRRTEFRIVKGGRNVKNKSGNSFKK